MDYFKYTTHLSEIIDESYTKPVVIFKYSSECFSSSKIKEEIEQNLENHNISKTIFLVTVQKEKSLSKKIEDFFSIKHESPQIIVLSNGTVKYHENHTNIKISNLFD